MFGSRFFTFITVALVGSTIVQATVAGPNVARAPGSGPVAALAVKRQDSVESQVSAILTSLQSTLAPTLADITALGQSGNVTEDAATPLLTQVSSAIDGATSQLKSIDPAIVARLAHRQSGDELADLLAGIIEAVVDAVDTLVGDLATIPILSGLLAGIDTSLASLLDQVELLVAGVLVLVANLLVNVAALLYALAFDLTIAALGL